MYVTQNMFLILLYIHFPRLLYPPFAWSNQERSQIKRNLGLKACAYYCLFDVAYAQINETFTIAFNKRTAGTFSRETKQKRTKAWTGEAPQSQKERWASPAAARSGCLLHSLALLPPSPDLRPCWVFYLKILVFSLCGGWNPRRSPESGLCETARLRV